MMKLFVIGVLILGFVGCGVVPAKVKYADYPKTAVGITAGDESGYQFRHRRSVIMLYYEGNSFKAIAAPYEFTLEGSYSPLYRMWGVDDLRSTTQLKVSYVDNTKFIDQIQVTTKDNTSDTIAMIGGVVKAVVTAAAVVASGKPVKKVDFKKTILDPSHAKIDQWTNDPLNKGYCMRLKDVASESPLSLAQYLTDGLGKWQGTFPVPACASGIVEIAAPCNDDNIIFSSRVTFADTDKVLPMSLPSSGSLKMNSVCGASVTEADKQDRTEVLKYLSETIKQTQDVFDAWKKAKTGK